MFIGKEFFIVHPQITNDIVIGRYRKFIVDSLSKRDTLVEKVEFKDALEYCESLAVS